MARSVDENILTTTGMIFCWYSSALRNLPTFGKEQEMGLSCLRGSGVTLLGSFIFLGFPAYFPGRGWGDVGVGGPFPSGPSAHPLWQPCP